MHPKHLPLQMIWYKHITTLLTKIFASLIHDTDAIRERCEDRRKK